MKKKLTEGEKNEKKLRFRFQELKRAKKIPLHMSFKQFRNSEFNTFVSKEVTFNLKQQGKIKSVTRKVKKYVSAAVLTEAHNITFPYLTAAPVSVPKAERRAARRLLKHKILLIIQEEVRRRKERKALEREARIERALERHAEAARKKAEKEKLKQEVLREAA